MRCIFLLLLWLIPGQGYSLSSFPVVNSPTDATALRYDISGSNAWYPYFIPDAKQPGIVAELIDKILKHADIKGLPVSLPPKRTLLALANGELDFDVVSPSWFPGQQVSQEFVLSDGLIVIKEYIVTLPENQHRYPTLSATFGQKIGTIRGYLYNNDHLFERVDFNSEIQLIQALRKGRIQAAILGDLPAVYWAEQSRTKIAFATLHSAGDLHIRLRKEHRYLLSRINRAIAALKDTGELTQIVAHYIGRSEHTLLQKTSD